MGSASLDCAARIAARFAAKWDQYKTATQNRHTKQLRAPPSLGSHDSSSSYRRSIPVKMATKINTSERHTKILHRAIAALGSSTEAPTIAANP